MAWHPFSGGACLPLLPHLLTTGWGDRVPSLAPELMEEERVGISAFSGETACSVIKNYLADSPMSVASKLGFPLLLPLMSHQCRVLEVGKPLTCSLKSSEIKSCQ